MLLDIVIEGGKAHIFSELKPYAELHEVDLYEDGVTIVVRSDGEEIIVDVENGKIEAHIPDGRTSSANEELLLDFKFAGRNVWLFVMSKRRIRIVLSDDKTIVDGARMKELNT